MRNLNKVKDKFYAGARRPPHPPSAERRAAIFWRHRTRWGEFLAYATTARAHIFSNR